MTYKFCVELNHFTSNSAYAHYQVFHYTSPQPDKRTNAAYLMGAYELLVLGRSPEEAWSHFAKLEVFKVFRDASPGSSLYGCTLLDCYRALAKAVKLGWFSLDSFNVKEYEYFEQLQHGDLNWILPGKLLAFSCPSENTYDLHGFPACQPEDYVRIFRQMGITAVVRLNAATYDSCKFTRQGLRHYDLIFSDGSCPSDDTVRRFLAICESERGAVAVHCKAGLGRTGTLIACYLMAKHHFLPEEVIPWLRICRPGSILGRQQSFLFDLPPRLARWGEQLFHEPPPSEPPTPSAEQDAADAAEADQAQRLLLAKRRYQLQNSQVPVECN
jgi:cell division cycle 14